MTPQRMGPCSRDAAWTAMALFFLLLTVVLVISGAEEFVEAVRTSPERRPHGRTVRAPLL